MKKLTVAVGILFLLSPVLPSAADTVVTVSSEPSTIVVQKAPVLLIKEDDPRRFEGEIIKVDYPKSQIVVHDTNGRDRRVIVKQGMISNYKVDDYVQVHLMADLREAKMIHIARHLSRYDGTIIQADPAVNYIIVRDTVGKERTALLVPGTVSQYRAGHRVRVYVVQDTEEARFIRVLD